MGDLAAANLRATAVRRGYRIESKKVAGVERYYFVGKGYRFEVTDILALGDKAQRAEPLSTLYETGRVHHVGRLPRLEDEMVEWNPKTGISPNGLDGLVHGAYELLGLDRKPAREKGGGMRGIAAANAAISGSRPNAPTSPFALSFGDGGELTI